MQRRDRLAVLGGFVAPDPALPHGTLQAQFRICEAIARSGRFRAIDVFPEDAVRRRPEVRLPGEVASRLLDRALLPACAGQYAAIYVASGEQILYVPHALRPVQDTTPVVCELGMASSPRQWSHLFLAAATGSLRAGDGFIFKAAFLERLFDHTWRQWQTWLELPPRPACAVVPNGVDLVTNARDERLRADTRRWLGLAEDDVLFLGWSRLDPVGKGDHRALVQLWSGVVRRWPRAVLALAGARMDSAFDRGHVQQLRMAARAAGVGGQVMVLDDPYQTWPDARERLMSAADVFVHASTGAEEVSSNAILEAMAHGLPVIAAGWAGFPEAVEHGETGFQVPTWVAEPPPDLQAMMLGRQAFYSNGDLERYVACDGPALARAAEALLANPSLRLEMGRRSRRRAEDRFGLAAVASRRVDFLEQLAGAAERRSLDAPPAPDALGSPGSPGSPRSLRSLLDCRAMLRFMGTRPLRLEDRLVLTTLAAAGEAPPDLVAGLGAPAGAIHRILRASAPLSVAEVLARAAGAAAAPSAEARADLTGPHDGAGAAAVVRELLRLVAHGAIQVLPAGEAPG